MSYSRVSVIDLRNQRFGSWLVLDKLPTTNKDKGGRPRTRWECVCDCGRTMEVLSNQLIAKRTSSCPVCSRRKLEKSAFLLLLGQIKYNARIRDIIFDVDDNYLINLLERQEFRCALTQLPICVATSARAHKKEKATTASLDRIDNEKGYVVGNVQWVHKKLNVMKHCMPQKLFIDICRMVVATHGEGNGTEDKRMAGYVDACTGPDDLFVRRDVFDKEYLPQPIAPLPLTEEEKIDIPLQTAAKPGLRKVSLQRKK